MEIRRILVPVDGSELSLKAADLAADLAARLVASVTVFAAVQPPEGAAHIRESSLEEVKQGLWRAAEVMLEQAASRVRSRHPSVEKRMIWGSPTAAIIAEAETGYGLIVMGSQGLGLQTSDRRVLGSIAERVLQRASCPVLVVPGRARG